MKLFNLNVGIKLDNNKEVVDLILKDLVFEQKHMNLE